MTKRGSKRSRSASTGSETRSPALSATKSPLLNASPVKSGGSGMMMPMMPMMPLMMPVMQGSPVKSKGMKGKKGKDDFGNMPLWSLGMPMMASSTDGVTSAKGMPAGKPAGNRKRGAAKKTKGPTGKRRGRPRTRPLPGEIRKRPKEVAIAPATFPNLGGSFPFPMFAMDPTNQSTDGTGDIDSPSKTGPASKKARK